MNDWFALIARLILGGYFFSLSFGKLWTWKVHMLRLNLSSFPLPKFFWSLSMLIYLVGGVLIIFGGRTLRLSALSLSLLYTLKLYWTARTTHPSFNSLLHELTVLSGLFLLVAFGGGQFALRLGRRSG